mmetsp:Transcript_132319/g.423340  ORF Transcript_132319/g.423340 Transcript_132319/m.423340 type:complete len:366 (-) Transcript_132319:521-1618(-)
MFAPRPDLRWMHHTCMSLASAYVSSTGSKSARADNVPNNLGEFGCKGALQRSEVPSSNTTVKRFATGSQRRWMGPVDGNGLPQESASSTRQSCVAPQYNVSVRRSSPKTSMCWGRRCRSKHSTAVLRTNSSGSNKMSAQGCGSPAALGSSGPLLSCKTIRQCPEPYHRDGKPARPLGQAPRLRRSSPESSGTAERQQRSVATTSQDHSRTTMSSPEEATNKANNSPVADSADPAPLCAARANSGSGANKKTPSGSHGAPSSGNVHSLCRKTSEASRHIARPSKGNPGDFGLGAASAAAGLRAPRRTRYTACLRVSGTYATASGKVSQTQQSRLWSHFGAGISPAIGNASFQALQLPPPWAASGSM